jgi:N-acetylglucosamine-6-phosphate deacetylase
MRTIVTADRLWSATGVIDNPVLEIEDGRIVEITSTREAWATPAKNFPGATIAPAFFDVHLHGAAGHDVMEASPEALTAIGALLAQHGTASYLATTVTAPLDETLRAVSGLAKLMNKPELLPQTAARPLGIHLEGPFLSHFKRGVQPAEHLLVPDIAIFNRLDEAAEGHIRMMTIAPELPGALDLITHAVRRGVRVSLGHSDATAAQTRAAIAAGAVSATHTFNAMRPMDHREPGILGTVLTDDQMFAELICDGVHVSPETVKLWWRAKGENRGVLVTDAISATGMPEGEYQLGGFPVQVADGRATARGVLAGSVLTQDRALSNFVEFTGSSVDEAVRLLTANPAEMTGMETASLAEGDPANFVVLESTCKLRATFIEGRLTPHA